MYLLNRDLNWIETPNANRNLVQERSSKYPVSSNLEKMISEVEIEIFKVFNLEQSWRK